MSIRELSARRLWILEFDEPDWQLYGHWLIWHRFEALRVRPCRWRLS